MIAKLLAISLLLPTAYGKSIGWPKKDSLPDFMAVAIDLPPIWGSESAVNDHSSFRVTMKNTRNSDIQLLNVDFTSPRFLLIKDDGSVVPLDIPIKNLTVPRSNPGLTIGPSSQVGFKIEMDRPDRPPNLGTGKVVLEITVTFTAGDIITKPDSKSGFLDGFEYGLVRRLSGAEQLLKAP